MERMIRKVTSKISLPVFIFIFFSSLYLLTCRGYVSWADNYAYLTCKSLVFEHDFSMAHDPVVFAEGHSTSIAPTTRMGATMVMLPMYLMGYLVSQIFPSNQEFIVSLFSSTTQVFITALTCSVIFMFARKLSYSARTSIILTLMYGLGTMAWEYSKGGFVEPLVSLTILSSLYFLRSFKDTGRRRDLLFAGFSIGFALVCKFYNIIVLPALLIYFLMNLEEKGRSNLGCISSNLPFFLMPVIVVLAFIGWYNLIRFGAFFDMGYHYPGSGYLGLSFMNMPIYIGLYGFLFSMGKSFFLYNLPTLLSFWGIRGFYKKHKSESVAIALIVVVYLFAFSSWWSWRGDYGEWGPRYILPLVPITLFPAGIVLEKMDFKKIGARSVILFTVIASILVQLPGVLMSHNRLMRAIGKQGFEGFMVEDMFFIPNLSPLVLRFTLLKLAILNFLGRPSNFKFVKYYIPFNIPGYVKVVKATIPLSPYELTPDTWLFKLFYFYQYGSMVRQDSSITAISVGKPIVVIALVIAIILLLASIVFGSLVYRKAKVEMEGTLRER